MRIDWEFPQQFNMDFKCNMNENKECSNCKKLFPKNIMSTPFRDKKKMGKY
jgi:hypothetical protein